MKAIFPYCLKIYGSEDFHHMDFTQRQLRRFIETSFIIFLTKHNTITLAHGGFVFYGRIDLDGKMYDKGSFLPAKSKVKSIEDESAIFKFESPQNLKSRIHKISHLYKADHQPIN